MSESLINQIALITLIIENMADKKNSVESLNQRNLWFWRCYERGKQIFRYFMDAGQGDAQS